MKKKLIAIIGATATGKTSLALKTAQAINGEIISVDSRQIYKELNIGSAKPSLEQQKSVKHHLIDIVSINQDYTVANFCDDAKNIINDIISRNKIPILTGGTGLYFRVLLQDFDLPRVSPDKELREKLEKFDSITLHKKLSEYDIELSKKIHPNNKVKIIRALEVCITLGQPMSSAQKKKEHEFDTLWLGLNSNNREFLYKRINNRVDIMINDGLTNEAKNLFTQFGENKILTSTIGYQEFLPYFKNEYTLEYAINLLKQNTRRYAKRQISWFNANKNIHWFDIETQNNIEQLALELINNWKL